MHHLCREYVSRYDSISRYSHPLTPPQERLYQIQHPQVAAEFDEVSRARDDEVGFWISRAWIKGGPQLMPTIVHNLINQNVVDWRLSKPKMHKPTGPDPPPDHKEYSEDVICEHGGLAPNVTARRRISTEVCPFYPIF